MSAATVLPTAADYRLRPDEIRADLCQARRFTDSDKDARWSPAIYRELQCEKLPETDSNLCAVCQRNRESHSVYGLRKNSAWKGFITDKPFDGQHMLGTKWSAKCSWIGGDPPAWWRPVVMAPAPVIAFNVPEEAPVDPRIAALESELTAERARSATLAQLLADALVRPTT